MTSVVRETTWLSDNADTLLAGRSWTPHELGLPWYFENPVFSAVVTMPEISVLDVRQIDSGEILVEARSNLDCEFDFLMAKLEYYTTAVEDSTFVNGLYISDADWNDHYVAASATITIGARVFLTFDPVRGEITSSDVRDLQVNPEPLANYNLI